jgi:RNA polymerase sigma-54 factor
MKLTQRPTLKQTQILAPQLIQSLKMLQVPILKLEQMIRHELAVNPMLEEVSPADDIDSDLESTENETADSEKNALEKIDWESYFGDDDELNEPYWTGSFERKEEITERPQVFEKNLYEHLNEQLNYTRLTEDELKIGQYLIGNIDDNGFLTVDIPDTAEALSVSEESVWKVLSVIQGFDPAGIGARNLRESLLIQLNNKNMVGTLPYLIVSKYFDRLDRLSHSQISRLLKVPQERVQKAFDEIKQLVPKPALGRFSRPAAPILPDLIVEQVDGEFVVLNNDRNLPKLHVSTAYRDMLKDKDKSSDSTKKYIKEKLDQARWLINSINQRRSTMQKVMQAIVSRQKEFFEFGESRLKPLRMEEIAEEVGMNVATICRVANEKYVQTPMGVFEIKYFFNSGVAKEDGEELARRNVKKRIEEIIKAEDTSKPLPDQKIKEILEKESIKIARRTVSKYREELGIKSARFRKRVKNENSSRQQEMEKAVDY